MSTSPRLMEAFTDAQRLALRDLRANHPHARLRVGRSQAPHRPLRVKMSWAGRPTVWAVIEPDGSTVLARYGSLSLMQRTTR